MSPLSLRRHEHALKGTRIVLVRPCYPENLGAVARAMMITGFKELTLVAPFKLADPAHPAARKMAVGSRSILENTAVVPVFDEAVGDRDIVVGTTARAGVRDITSPRQAALEILDFAAAGKSVAIVFGGEGSGLRKDELSRCSMRVKIPMVGNEPSLNLSQAVMVILYELLVSALSRQ